MLVSTDAQIDIKNHNLSLPLHNCEYFHLHAFGTFDSKSVSYIPEIQLEIKKPFRQKKAQPFCRWCCCFLSSLGFCCCCHSLWWKEKSPKNPLESIPACGWQCSNLLIFNHKQGGHELNLSQIQAHFWNVSLVHSAHVQGLLRRQHRKDHCHLC